MQPWDKYGQNNVPPYFIPKVDSWSIKKTECQRIDAFKLWCWKTRESPLDSKEIKPVNLKGNQSWIFIGRIGAGAWTSNTLATWCEVLTHLKRPLCWERLKAGGQVDDRGWGGWRASPTQWTWVWASSRSWWWTGKPDVLQSMGSQRVRYDWATELNWKFLSLLMGKILPYWLLKMEVGS